MENLFEPSLQSVEANFDNNKKNNLHPIDEW
jgi:hypothetical protein